MNFSYQKYLEENPEVKRKAIQKRLQKQRIKREYAKALKKGTTEAKQAAGYAKKAATTTTNMARKVAEFARKHIRAIATIGFTGKDGKEYKQILISSMEESAIREGFANLKPGYMYNDLYQSALCRQQADWLVGINGTRLFTVLYNRLLKVGRVQTPTLAMLVDRDEAIRTFKKRAVLYLPYRCKRHGSGI